ncbi:Imm8 family immunity protein [Marinobacter sp. HN1S83]|uniref:Imm8 family immunity protein n=1 Tax=Marinobacter sp. HN1S83 TaxID=3382301 RepID=UPI00387ACB57
MKPVILSYDCSDHDPIDQWAPNDVYDVDFWMNFTIGPDHEGGDNFQVHIVTPNNLHGRNATKHAIVLNEFSWPAVLAEVKAILAQCEGPSWSEISEKLSGYMAWEYEGYRP